MGAKSIYFDSTRGPCGPTVDARSPGETPSGPLEVRGLVFGMDNVLYDATVWRRWLLQLVTRLGIAVQYDAFFQVWDRDYLNAVQRGQREFGEAFQTFLAAAGLSCGQIDEVEASSQARRRDLEARARPLPGVRTTLAKLRQAGMALAVVADAEYPADRLAQQLATMGLGGDFSAVVSSFDLECTKPDPSCYRAALSAMGLAAGEVAFVGHRADELQGAQHVGMRTLAFNFCREAVADRYLERFDELLDLPNPIRRIHEEAA